VGIDGGQRLDELQAVRRTERTMLNHLGRMLSEFWAHVVGFQTEFYFYLQDFPSPAYAAFSKSHR
jgi:hypothetical protein